MVQHEYQRSLVNLLYWIVFFGMAILGLWTFGAVYLFESNVGNFTIILGLFLVLFMVSKEKEIMEKWK